MTKLSLWRVYASEGRGKRKDQRVVQAERASDAMSLAKKARGWGNETYVSATCLGPVFAQPTETRHA